MKIGINGRYLGPNKTGVGRYLISLLQEWQRVPRGHEFFVYTSTEVLTDEDRSVFTPDSPIIHRQVPRPVGTSSFHLWYNWSLPRAMQRDRINWFFSPDYFCPIFWPKSMKRSLTMHDVSYLAHPDWFPLLYRWYGLLFSKIPARRADLIFAVSEFSRQEIQAYVRADPTRIVVTPEAVNNRFHPGPNARPKIQGLTGRYFLYVGKIFNRRHVAELLQAFDQYLTGHSDRQTQLVIRGGNETKPVIDIYHLAQSINQKHARRAVLQTEYISDEQLIGLYQSAAGFFYLSTYEGFGLPVLEALACGIPTVTVRATSIPEVAGEAAVYVDPTNQKQLTDTMHRLLNDPAWTTALRQQATAQASRFTWAKTAEQTLTAIERADAT